MNLVTQKLQPVMRTMHKADCPPQLLLLHLPWMLRQAREMPPLHHLLHWGVGMLASLHGMRKLRVFPRPPNPVPTFIFTFCNEMAIAMHPPGRRLAHQPLQTFGKISRQTLLPGFNRHLQSLDSAAIYYICADRIGI